MTSNRNSNGPNQPAASTFALIQSLSESCANAPDHHNAANPAIITKTSSHFMFVIFACACKVGTFTILLS